MAEEGDSERLSKKASSVTRDDDAYESKQAVSWIDADDARGHVKHTDTVWGVPNLPTVMIPGSGVPGFQDRYPDHHSDCVSYPNGVETFRRRHPAVDNNGATCRFILHSAACSPFLTGAWPWRLHSVDLSGR